MGQTNGFAYYSISQGKVVEPFLVSVNSAVQVISMRVESNIISEQSTVKPDDGENLVQYTYYNTVRQVLSDNAQVFSALVTPLVQDMVTRHDLTEFEALSTIFRKNSDGKFAFQDWLIEEVRLGVNGSTIEVFKQQAFPVKYAIVNGVLELIRFTDEYTRKREEDIKERDLKYLKHVLAILQGRFNHTSAQGLSNPIVLPEEDMNGFGAQRRCPAKAYVFKSWFRLAFRCFEQQIAPAYRDVHSEA